jgi:hypothetical protein
MTPSRKKPGVAFWATVVVVVVLAAYPLSFGPACWLADRNVVPYGAIYKIFSPFLDIAFHRESPIAPFLNWWADAGARREGAARRIVCKGYADEIGCGSIDGCSEDDFEP